MGMRTLEAAILRELRLVANSKSLRQKDILEWSTKEVKVLGDETRYYLPELRVHVAIKTKEESCK